MDEVCPGHATPQASSRGAREQAHVTVAGRLPTPGAPTLPQGTPERALPMDGPLIQLCSPVQQIVPEHKYYESGKGETRINSSLSLPLKASQEDSGITTEPCDKEDAGSRVSRVLRAARRYECSGDGHISTGSPRRRPLVAGEW